MQYKSLKLRFITVLVIVTIIVNLIILVNKKSLATDDLDSGTSGTCSWVIDSEGVLTISPTEGDEGILDSYTSLTNEESTVPWKEYREVITKVVINPGVKTNEDCEYLFYGLTNCTEMELTNLDTSTLRSAKHFFSRCTSLTELDLSNFDFSNIKNTNYFLYTVPLRKIILGENFRFPFSAAHGGLLPNGMWLKEGDKEYTASEIIRNNVDTGMAGTYTRTKNVAEGLEIYDIITYKIELNSAERITTINGDNIIQNGSYYYFVLPDEADEDDYLIDGSIDLVFPNSAKTADGHEYTVHITVDNMHIYNFKKSVTDQQKYLRIYQNNATLIDYYCTDSFNTIADIADPDVNYDVTIEVLDQNNEPLDGTFIFSIYDLDTSDERRF